MDTSWIMKVLNEAITRLEDKVTDRFWEGRIKSQALLDEAAMIAYSAYVDINSIRTKMAGIPKVSEHTSIKQRIEKAASTTTSNYLYQQLKPLLRFVGNPRCEVKCGSIGNNLPPILEGST